MSIPYVRYLSAIVVLVLVAPLAAADRPNRAAIDELVKPFLQGKPYLGLVVGITRPAGQEVFGYGQVTLDGKQRVPDEKTIYEIGSLTKIFTGTLLADQVLCGAVRLDDPVQKYLPADLVVPRRDDRDISLLHLATHTSSLPHEPPFMKLFALTTKDSANPYAQYDEVSLRRTLAGLNLSRPIGSRFDYSNLGVGLLGHALAHASKAKNYEDLLVQRLAKPLGLADTRLRLSDEQAKRLAPGHDKDGKRTTQWTFACLEACGGLRSTAHDLLLFVDAASGRRKTPLAEAFRMAQQPWRERFGGPNQGQQGQSVGFCWFREPLPWSRSELVWHNGETGGYRSFLALIPEKQVGVVLLSNSRQHALGALGMPILKRIVENENENGPRR